MKTLHIPKPLALGLAFTSTLLAAGTVRADDGACKVAYQECLKAGRPAKVCYYELLQCTGEAGVKDLQQAVAANVFDLRDDAELDAFLSSLE